MDLERRGLDRRQFLKGTAAATVMAALPTDIAEAQQRAADRQKASPETDISQLKESFPELAKKWERIPALLRGKAWNYSFATDNKLQDQPEAREFIAELHRTLEASISIDHFGKSFDLHDLAFAQVAGRRGYMLNIKKRDILSELARAKEQAGITFDTQIGREDKAIRELLGKKIRKGDAQISQLSYASAALTIGPYRDDIEREWEEFTGLQPSKRMVIPHGQRVGQGGILEPGERALSEVELKKYIETGEPILAAPQYAVVEDGKTHWVHDEDALVPRDLTYNFDTNEVVPYSFTDKFPDKFQKQKGLSPSLAVTLGYLQSLLHDKARNDPNNKGVGWRVTGNIATLFLNNLKKALELTQLDEGEKGKERLKDFVLARIVKDEILPKVKDIRIEGVNSVENLFESLSEFVKIDYAQPIRQDFALEMERYGEGTGRAAIDRFTLWEILTKERRYSDDKDKMPEEIAIHVSGRPQDDTHTLSTNAEYPSRVFEAKVPQSVLQLARDQEVKIKEYGKVKSEILVATRTVTSEKFPRIEASKGAQIDFSSLLTSRQRSMLRDLPVKVSLGSSKLITDERTGAAYWFGSNSTGDEFHWGEEGKAGIRSDAPEGIYEVSLQFSVELPEPPLGSPDYADYHASGPRGGRGKYQTFTGILPVRVIK